MWESLLDAPTLIRRFVLELASPRGIRLLFQVRFLLLFVGPIVYVLSPFDLLPEAVFGLIGLLDDMVILVVCGVIFASFYRAFSLRRAAAAAAAGGGAGAGGEQAAGNNGGYSREVFSF
jgi:RING finger protein 170